VSQLEEPKLSADQEVVLELLRKFGRNAYSFEVLEPGLSYWFCTDGDGVVAYVDRGFHWVALGGPICPRERLLQISTEFVAAAAQHRKAVAFFAVSDRFTQALGKDSGFDWLQIGEHPCWDPRRWAEIWEKAGKVRNRVKRAKREGISVRHAAFSEFQEGAPLRDELDALVNRWVQAHSIPPMQFMATVDLYSHGHERRYFLAQQNDRLVGLLMAVPVYGQNGWLLEDMVIERGTAGGTAEALIDLAMRTFGDEGAGFASLGLVALSGLKCAGTWRHILFTFMLNWCYRSLSWLYNCQGLYAFRSKFLPTAWEPVYLVAYPRITLITIRAVMMAFTGGWVPFFAFKSAAWRVRKPQVPH